jgi:hypothetical protein
MSRLRRAQSRVLNRLAAVPDRWNALQWDGEPGHYEVYYVTFTDTASGVGFWIRYTMVAPLPETGEDATCSLWFMAMDPADPSQNVGEKVSFPISELHARDMPFELRIGDAVLTDTGMKGALEHDGRRCEWDLKWLPTLPAYGHVHPFLRRAGIAKTVLFLPHPDVKVSGTVAWDGRSIDVAPGTQGGQAHLWGSKHATRWAWVHCNDFGESANGGTFVDGVSVFVPRFSRELGPNTPVVARVGGADVMSISPLAVQRNQSDFGPWGWTFEAKTLRRKLECSVTARPEDLVGVTYHDPDGELAYCYNTEVADLRMNVFERSGPFTEWRKTGELVSDRRAHFEYAQRTPIEGLGLAVE